MMEASFDGGFAAGEILNFLMNRQRCVAGGRGPLRDSTAISAPPSQIGPS